MRRKDREVTDKAHIYEIMKSCHCCRIGLYDNGQVYIVPMNFGEVIEEEKITLYFHSAKEGRKIDLIKQNPRVGFEMDTNYQLKTGEQACHYSAKYQSIIGEGIAEIVENSIEKTEGLKAIMRHATGQKESMEHATGKEWEFKEEMIEAVCVFKLMVDKISCKES